MLPERDIRQLRSLINFPALVAFLRDRLDWPLEADNIEDLSDLTYSYETAELGIDPRYAAKIERVRQLRNLVDDQPWGIFYIEFDSRRLPVGALRRILNAFVASRRAREAERPVWNLSDLLFICVQGPPGSRGVAFAHFRRAEGRNAPELRTFSWDSHETHFYYLTRLNLAQLRWPADDSDHEAWRRQWRSAFTARYREIIRTSEKLAEAMAEHAAIIRQSISDRYAVETENDPLRSLFQRFKELLLHDLTPDAFADMVAQTITYGLFSAAEQSADLSYAGMVALIPKTNPFLKQLLAALIEEAGLDLSELGVGPLLNLLREAPVTQIAQAFGRRTASGQEDPVIHFYEQFLQEYDRQQRVERGVFYTPDPVVSYIVRAVDDLLKSEFGIAGGLASAERDPATNEHRVQILDPAAGTGTFLAHIIDRIAAAQHAADTPAWNDYVAEDLLPRLNGFELMMAPYAIAHMKLGLKLRQTGYKFESDERLRIFLTNALEKPEAVQYELATAGFLGKEFGAAAEVKELAPITVVIGNPPYSGESNNDIEWINNLLRGSDGKGNDVANYFKVDGHGLNERNPKWLNNDYVKFIRFGQWRINQTGAGILAYITDNSYLDSPTFRGMRQSLMDDFDKIYILNLHGNSNKREVAPDGGEDKNVFDIRQGVAILLAVKLKAPVASCQVFLSDLWGIREKKYEFLSQKYLDSTQWELLNPTSPNYLFLSYERELEDEYLSGKQLPTIAPVNNMGITTGNDSKLIAFEEHNLSNAFPDSSKIIDVAYRPFDIRKLYYDASMLARARQDFMSHLQAGENLALCSLRRPRNELIGNFYVTDLPTDKCIISSLDNAQVFPIYVYPKQNTLFDISLWKLSDKGRRPNLDPAFVQELVNKLNLSFITEGRGDLQNTFGPEDIFHYAYAVFHSPAYRQRYAEFLKIDFPRLPLTNDVALFRKLAQLGADLVALHLLEDEYQAASWNLEGEDSPLAQTGVDFITGANGATVGAVSKSTAFQNGRVYIDTKTIKKGGSCFTGVPEAVWNFHIGGYQVCHKWLYDRRGKSQTPGRVLTEQDIEHYKRIVAALRETMVLMEQIDRVIDNHGGWPLPGSQPDVEPEANEEDEIEMTISDNREPDFTTENLEDILNRQFGEER